MISVAMATYNGEKYINKQLRSVIRNLSDEDEIVISDDGSIDGTIEVIKGIRDKRIKIIEGPHDGISRNFENAIRNCSGDYIFLCDQDDVWYDGKVKSVCEKFAKTNCILVEHDAKITDGSGNVLFTSFFNLRKVRTGVLKNIIRNTYHGCLMAFKAELKNEIIPFPKNGCLHDQWIGLVAEMNGNTIFLNEILMDYRRHGENASSFEHLSLTRQIKDRMALIQNVMRYRKSKWRKSQ